MSLIGRRREARLVELLHCIGVSCMVYPLWRAMARISISNAQRAMVCREKMS